MSAEIDPALSPEDWKNLLEFIARAPDGYLVDVITVAECTIGTAPGSAEMMALANATLADDDPQKITRADVRELLSDLEEFKIGDPAGFANGAYIGLRRVAAKLAALLPPDGS